MALAWLVAQPGVTSTILGTRTLAQLEDNVQALGITLTADDLALLACAALRYGRPNRAYNATDDSEMKMGEYFDLVADTFGLARPPRVGMTRL